MKRALILSFIISGINSACLAQTAGQVAETNPASVAAFYADSVRLYLHRYGTTSSYYLSSLIKEKVNTVSFAGNLQQGNFIPSQGATRSIAGGMNAEGGLSLSGIKLFGSFSYYRTTEDSTRFAHQTRSNGSSPFYFGSPAFVHYERSVYQFKSMAGRDFLGGRLNISLGLDYKVGDHFSNNDPRGSVGEYQLDIAGSAAYRATNKLKLGLAWRPGYGQEKVGVAYKNPRYYESSSFPMYYNHLINGYGEGAPALTGDNRKYTDDQKRNGFSIYADLAANKRNTFFLQGGINSEDQRFYTSSDKGFQEKADYSLNATRFDFLWLRSAEKGSFIGRVSFSDRQGKDFNLNYQANNYIYSASDLNMDLLMNQYGRKTIANYQLNASLHREERVDGVKGNDLVVQTLLLKIGAGIDQTDKTKAAMGLNIKGIYSVPLQTTFKVGEASESFFTQYVIYHDYLFHTSSYTGGEISAKYGRPVGKDMSAEIILNCGYQYQLGSKSINRNIVSKPGSDRFYSNINFNVYF